jgi:hypothetical protein
MADSAHIYNIELNRIELYTYNTNLSCCKYGYFTFSLSVRKYELS